MVHHPPHLKQQPVMSSDPVPHQSTLGSVQMLKAGARTMRPGFDCSLYGCAGVVRVRAGVVQVDGGGGGSAHQSTLYIYFLMLSH